MQYKWYQFDPLKSFLALPILWVVIAVFVGFAGLAFVVINHYSSLEFGFDYVGFNQFLSFFKVPLGILALIIPVVALLAANHRSEQTKAQIESTRQQNTFSNFYKHIEEFEKYVEAHIDKSTTTFNSMRGSHRVIFPNAISGDYSVGNNLLNTINGFMNDLVNLVGYFHGGHPKKEIDTIYQIQKTLEEIDQLIGINSTVSGVEIDSEGSKITIPKKSAAMFFSQLRNRVAIVNTILSFDHEYNPSKPTLKLTTLDLGKVPSHNFVENKGMNAQSFNPFTR